MLLPRPARLSAALALLSAVPLAVADFAVRDGKLAVLSSAGTTRGSVSFSSSSPPKSPLTTLSVEALDTVRLTFSLSTPAGGASDDAPSDFKVPAQTVVLARGADTGRTWTGLVKVRAGGKARWELDLSRAPSGLLSLSESGKVQLDLLIGDFGDAHRPVRIPLAEVELAPELLLPHPYWGTEDGKPPAQLEWEKYAVEPELHWTFRGGEKPVNPTVSLAFTLIALSPWALLLGAWSRIARDGGSSGFSLLSSPSPATLLFLLCLGAEEGLILVYWTSLRLYQYLPLALGLAVPLVLTGRTALSQLRLRRTERPIGGTPRGAATSVGVVKGKKVE